MTNHEKLLVSSEEKQESDITLPNVAHSTGSLLQSLTQALGVPRNVLATDDEISHLWSDLPRLLQRIPSDLVDEHLAKMCVAIAVGLFDSAINYVWNAAIVELRGKMRRFGLNVIPQITDDDEFDENKLLDLQDSELLRFCLNLNLISVNAYFMLEQCRDIRNNFSSAHPPKGQLDEYELLSFLNRVSKYALQTEQNLQAVDIQDLIASVELGLFSDDQLKVWCERIEGTYEAQRETVFGMLHGMYCDPDKSEHTRVNALRICLDLHARLFTPKVRSLILDRHQDYRARGASDRHKQSQVFFEELGLVSILSDSERHVIITGACRKLMDVHSSRDNFYNEPPFAERLLELTSRQGVPKTAQSDFVECVVTCSVGNQYGTSRKADEFYVKLVQGFSPREIGLMLELPGKRNLVVADRIRTYARCREEFRVLVDILASSSVPSSHRRLYERWKT
ncbi:MAG: hypothetical protein OXI30_18510 [Chloroflexota bacterium]|nr:hypothetical protein [Chloroflexota bacterium]